MGAITGDAAHHDHHHESSEALAASLAPLLRERCNRCLGEIRWFRSTWQHGGASTGSATWTWPDGRTTPVIVKLPVGGVEHAWTARLGACDDQTWTESVDLPTPRVVAHDQTLGPYDLAWLIVERLEPHAAAAHPTRQWMEEILAAAAAFHARASSVQPITGHDARTDWEDLVAKSRAATKNLGHEAQQWNETLKRVQKHLPRIVSIWESRAIDTWCHGDLHPGNALRRERPDGTHRCVLIDMAMVHPGSWIQDAVYLERILWSRPDLLDGFKPVSMLAKLRREAGLPTTGDYAAIANARRVLSAACAPLEMGAHASTRSMHISLEHVVAALQHLGM